MSPDPLLVGVVYMYIQYYVGRCTRLRASYISGSLAHLHTTKDVSTGAGTVLGRFFLK